MTTAQIVAVILVVIAVIDGLLGYLWLLPKYFTPLPPEKLAMLSPEKKLEAAQRQKTGRILRVVLDCWVVIALAIAYFLWNNPDTF